MGHLPPKIDAIKIKNFRALKSVELKNLSNYCVFVGANGVGKTTIFNVFQFLKNAMETNITKALIKLGGVKGFQEVRSSGETGNIEIEIKFYSHEIKRRITYKLSISEENKKAVVEEEVLSYRRGSRGKPWDFLKFSKGKGNAVTNELDLDKVTDEKKLHRDEQTLKSTDILAVKGLSQFEKFPATLELANLIENWYISDFHIQAARREQTIADNAEMLDRTGNNLFVVVDYLYQNHPKAFEKILEKLKERIVNIEKIETSIMENGSVLLKFFHSSFSKPILAPYISDGTLRMLGYLILLYHPTVHPLLGVEEPENQLYPSLLSELAEEFRSYANRGGQVFVSTHSPDFLNALDINEVFLLSKKDGFTTITPAENNETIKHYMKQGDKMGRLWKQGIFKIDP